MGVQQDERVWIKPRGFHSSHLGRDTFLRFAREEFRRHDAIDRAFQTRDLQDAYDASVRLLEACDDPEDEEIQALAAHLYVDAARALFDINRQPESLALGDVSYERFRDHPSDRVIGQLLAMTYNHGASLVEMNRMDEAGAIFERAIPYLGRPDVVACVAASSATFAASIWAAAGNPAAASEIAHALATRFGDPEGLRRASDALPFTAEAENMKMAEETSRRWETLLASH